MEAMYGLTSDVYEGSEPYLFISYSHKDSVAMDAIRHVLHGNRIRYWYDNGLHSGDDWNMVIARRLKDAAACLLLLSPNSAQSEYVKNELNFAMNHRIPIHTLLMKQFEMPLDIEMMTGRIQMVEMEGDYQQKLMRALPPEVFSDVLAVLPKDGSVYEHPLFETEKLLSHRQGTKIHGVKHKRLNYTCVMLEEQLQNDELAQIGDRLAVISKVDHPILPKMIDYGISGNRVLVYQENTGARFLDDYLTTVSLSEETILSWVTSAVEGVAKLYRMHLAFRDFARGSMVVTEDETLKILRAYHPYYGYVKFREETKRYYFEKELQEIAILLAQLCLGKEPRLPIRMVEEKRFGKRFLMKVNLIIQKCVKENGNAQYRNFEELLQDLKTLKVSQKEKAFLKKRAQKLLEYDKARQQRQDLFVSNDRPAQSSVTHQNLEEQFGFEGTVFLQETSVEGKSQISVMVCSTGQVLSFDKREITVGKDTRCDMVWTQPYISRMHLIIVRNDDGTYTLKDLNATNGTYVATDGQGETAWERIPCGSQVTVRQGTKIRIGSSEICVQ